MNDILASIKEKAIQNWVTKKSTYGNYSEIVNGHKIHARVSQQAKNYSDAVYCLWYLDDKKSSLAKVIAAIK